MRELLRAAAVGCMLAALGGVARADFDSELARVGTQLELTFLHGYPRGAEAWTGMSTCGLELRNLGEERTLDIAVSAGVRTQRQVRLAAHATRRVFTYLPVRDTIGSVTVTDRTTGASSTLSCNATVSGNSQLARLGSLRSALNVESPWEMAGALDAHMPDDWRGLAGVQAIVVEHAQLMARRASWPVLQDWMVMGGELVVLSTPEELAEPAPIDLPAPFTSEVKETWLGLVQRVGLGALARVRPEKIASVSARFRDDICDEGHCGFVFESRKLMPDQVSVRAARRLDNVVTNHAGALFAVLACFVLVVGPFGHTFFVRRRRQPLRYVALAAGTAASFSAAVIGADVLSTGVRTKASVRSLVLIDQRVDKEIGVEDLALYEPTGLGFDLQPLAAAQLFLPLHDWRESSDRIELEPAGKRVRVRNAVPAREPRSLGARWLGEASGRLIVAADGGKGLQVENQLGRDLRSLAVWHDGQQYTLGALARGKRARAEPVGESWVSPSLPSSLITDVYSHLLSDVGSGARGANHYLAEAEWNPQLSGVTTGKLELAKQPELLITGVY